MTQTQRIASFALGAIGALIGSATGYCIFIWIECQAPHYWSAAYTGI